MTIVELREKRDQAVGTLRKAFWRPTATTRTVCCPMRMLRPTPRWRRRCNDLSDEIERMERHDRYGGSS